MRGAIPKILSAGIGRGRCSQEIGIGVFRIAYPQAADMSVNKNQIHGIAMPPAIRIAATRPLKSIQLIMAVVVITTGAVIESERIAVSDGQAWDFYLV